MSGPERTRTPRRDQDHESCRAGYLPKDKKSGHQRYLFSRLGRDSDRASLVILQRSCPLEYVVPSERLEACWRSGGYG